jgi:putative PIN family toxin of toxin-antitoxin system
MNERDELVVDTNSLVSAALLFNAVPGQAVRLAVAHGRLLVSADTLAELIEVLARPKFDRYQSPARRETFVRAFLNVTKLVAIVETIRACRDTRDDKFLEVAVNGRARAIVTGDQDLLALNPFRGIPIITAATYLSLHR